LKEKKQAVINVQPEEESRMASGMITEQKVRKIICESLQKILDSKMVPKEFPIDDDTPLIGRGGNLDSISFVAFATDVEERIEDEIGREFILKLQEIHDLNEDKNALIVGDMARLVTQIINRTYAKA
jgi:acyl carrier protein